MLAAEELRLLVFPRLRQDVDVAMDEWVDWESDTGTARPPTPLPPITVTASRDTWWVDELLFRSRFNRTRSLSDIIDWEYVYYDGPTCADFSELYLAEDELLRQMEEETDLMRVAIESIQGLSCDPKPGFDICIDMFIASQRAIIFGGDNRTFNPEAGIAQSRGHFFLNSQTLARDAMINDSKLVLGGHVLDQRNRQSVLFQMDSDYVVTMRADTIHVKLKIANSYCISRPCVMAVDAEIFFIPDATTASGYKVGWKRDAYPSMGIYKSGNGGQSWTTTMAQDPENGMGPYLAAFAVLGKWRQSIHMPPGCDLQ